MKKRLICRSTHFSSKDKAERFIKKSPAPIKDAGDFFNSRFFCDFIFLLFKSYCNFAFSFIPFFLIINLNYNFVFHIIVICKRISQNTVQADFKVQMVSRRVPRTAYEMCIRDSENTTRQSNNEIKVRKQGSQGR